MQEEDLGLFLRQERGQFLDFVSAYEHKNRGARKKPTEDLAREIARLISGMANTDGGTHLSIPLANECISAICSCSSSK
jgi:hypothetical protein